MDYKISIEDLENSPSKTIDFHFEDKIEGLNCVTPIISDLEVKSLGEFVEVTGNVKGTLKLECDLCLKEFDYPFDFNIDENGELIFDYKLKKGVSKNMNASILINKMLES